MTLGRSSLLASLLAAGERPGSKAQLAEAAASLEAAVLRLREAGKQDVLPRGPIALACLRGVTGDEGDALSGLAEAEEIASRGPMRLHLADVYLNRARLRLGWHLRGHDTQLQEIRKDFERAKDLIEETGYHRRDREISDLEQAFAAAEGP